MEFLEITTPCGSVKGSVEDGVARFLGIPFAKAERFSYPTEVTQWDGALEALSYAPAPIQKMAYHSVDCNDPSNFYEHETMKGIACTYSEDCLYLNIWAPEHAEKAPVLVVIFGGGEVTGHTNELPYDGTAFAKKGVITVFLSYRLNIFGFIALEELAKRDGKTGNYAYYDQQKGIEWVRHNIAAFGGDPENMTLAGQSAGAANCEAQIKSPLNKGIFKQAVIQSSAGFTTGLKVKDNRKAEYAKWHKIFEASGCSNLDEFCTLPAKTLFSLFEKESAGKINFCNTIYDKDFGSELRNAPCDTKIMIGITSEDVMPFLLSVFADILCKSQKKAGVPTYRYFFKRQLPGDNKGAWHSSDLWYFYGALDKCWRPFSEDDHRLADVMQDYAVNFFKTGDPNGKGLLRWEPALTSKKDYIFFDELPARMDKLPQWKLLKTMLTAKPL